MNAITPRRVSARSLRHFAKRWEPLRDTWPISTSCPLATSRSFIELHSPSQECQAFGRKTDEQASFKGACSERAPLFGATALIQSP
jgi:hypothetical protein